jgi:hypothetical protein
LKARREAHAVFGAGNHDAARLQWLSQNLQYLAIKFRELIEEQHTMVGESYFAGLRFRTTVGLRNRSDGPVLQAPDSDMLVLQ